MSTVRQIVSPRLTLLVLILVFAVTYAAVASGLKLGKPAATAPAGASSVQDGVMSSSADVSDAVFNTLKQQLSDMRDLEELVVLPAANGAVTVSATVQLAGEAPEGQGSDIMQEDVKTFFQNVYSSDVNVSDANIYFLQAGQLVGGAGLGESAYHKLSIPTSSSPQEFADTVAAQPMNASKGPAECWFETRLDAGN